MYIPSASDVTNNKMDAAIYGFIKQRQNAINTNKSVSATPSGKNMVQSNIAHINRGKTVISKECCASLSPPS